MSYSRGFRLGRCDIFERQQTPPLVQRTSVAVLDTLEGFSREWRFCLPLQRVRFTELRVGAFPVAGAAARCSESGRRDRRAQAAGEAGVRDDNARNGAALRVTKWQL